MKRKVISLFKRQRGFSGLVNVVTDWSDVANIQKKTALSLSDFLESNLYIVHGLHNFHVFFAVVLKFCGARIFFMPHGQFSFGHTRSLLRRVYQVLVKNTLRFYD